MNKIDDATGSDQAKALIALCRGGRLYDIDGCDKDKKPDPDDHHFVPDEWKQWLDEPMGGIQISNEASTSNPRGGLGLGLCQYEY